MGERYGPGARNAPPARTVTASGSRKSVQLPAGDDLVDDPVLLGLLGREDLVPVDVLADLLSGLGGVPRQDVLHLRAHALDLRRVDLQVGHLATGLTGGLVD